MRFPLTKKKKTDCFSQTVYEIVCYKVKKIRLIFGLISFNYKYDIHKFALNYRIDQDYYWFVRRSDGHKHHTKRGLDGSVEIIDGIKMRAKKYGYEVEEIIVPPTRREDDKKTSTGIFLDE